MKAKLRAVLALLTLIFSASAAMAQVHWATDKAKFTLEAKDGSVMEYYTPSIYTHIDVPHNYFNFFCKLNTVEAINGSDVTLFNKAMTNGGDVYFEFNGNGGDVNKLKFDKNGNANKNVEGFLTLGGKKVGFTAPMEFRKLKGDLGYNAFLVINLESIGLTVPADVKEKLVGIVRIQVGNNLKM